MSEGARERALALIGGLALQGGHPPEPDMRLSDAGLDSLAVAELAAAVERDLGVDLSVADLVQDSRIEDVLRAVEHGRPRIAQARPPAGTGRLQQPARFAGGWAFRRWFRLRVVGSELVPRTGPAVLAMNHESALDIPIIVVACPRPVTFMAKKELFKNGAVSWALRGLGGFRVDRDRFDLWAMGAALSVVGRGGLLGMYPEGTRSPGRLLPFLPGAAWIAVGAGVPLVPCTIAGTERARDAIRPGRVQVRVEFHEPITIDREDAPTARRRRADEVTERLRTTIEAGLAGSLHTSRSRAGSAG